MTRLRSLALVVALAALVLGACSDDETPTSSTTTTTEDQAATTTTEATTTDDVVAADEWAEAFCADFGRWTDELQVIAAATAEPAATSAEARDDLAALFGKAAVFTTALADATEDGPAPDVDDGAEVQAALVDRFRVFAATAATTQAAVEALDPDSPTLAADADRLAADFRNQVAGVGDSFAEIDAQYGSAELGAALIDACDF